MKNDANDRQQRLQKQGLMLADELPREYQAVIEGLTPDELEVVLAVKRRLDEADRVKGIRPRDDGLPGFVNYLVF
jgi:hypothetical protein